MNIPYRNVLERQRFAGSLRKLRLRNKKKKVFDFDIKDVDIMVKHLGGLEELEVEDCKLTDEIGYVLLSGFENLSKFFFWIYKGFLYFF